MGKKKYFPNNVDALLEAPAELFKQIEFDEFMDWKVCGWDLPDSVECIIRSRNTRTNKVKEWIYERPADARKRLLKLKEDEDNDISVVTHDEIIHLTASDY